MLPVLRKEDSRNSELGQETSAHQSSTDLRRGRRSVGGRSNGQSHTVGWVQGERVPFGGGLLKVAPIAQHRLSDPRCTHALDGGASNYSVGWLPGITEFRSFSSLHMIVTMFISKRFKLVLRDFCANRSARNLCSKLRRSALVNQHDNQHES